MFPSRATLGNLTPTFPEFATTFSTPVFFQMRGGEDEIWLPEDIQRLFCPLTSHLLFFISLSFFSVPLLFLTLLFFLSCPSFVVFRCCFPEASFNKAVMMQIYFGWGHLASLFQSLHPPPLCPPSSPSILFLFLHWQFHQEYKDLSSLSLITCLIDFFFDQTAALRWTFTLKVYKKELKLSRSLLAPSVSV